MLPSNLTKIGFNTPGDKIEIETLIEIRHFIRMNFEKIEKINSSKTSYGLKQGIESILGIYITNGDFIASMILEGFRYKQKGMNAYFNISKKS